MKLYTGMGPNPRTVRIFMAEKGIEIPLEQVDLLGGENRRAVLQLREGQRRSCSAGTGWHVDSDRVGVPVSGLEEEIVQKHERGRMVPRQSSGVEFDQVRLGAFPDLPLLAR